MVDSSSQIGLEERGCGVWGTYRGDSDCLSIVGCERTRFPDAGQDITVSTENRA